MSLEIVASGVASFGAGLIGTLFLRRSLVARDVLDHPNARSSHDTPVPRGGGVAFVLVTLALLGLAIARGHLPPSAALVVAAFLATAMVGFVDDLRGVSARARLAVHLAAGAGVAIAALLATGSATVGDAGAWSLPLTAGLVAVVAVAVAWHVNLSNFMDGIDGLAAMQGVFVLLAASLLAHATWSSEPSSSLGIVLGAAVAGFLVVNISPWRLFMGDAGSGSLGLLVAWYLVQCVADGAIRPLAAAVLPALFVVDATTTLLVRGVRRQRLTEGHRTHAYQRLVRRGWTHRRTTGAYAAVNVFVVGPLAYAYQFGALASPWPVVTLYGILTLTALRIGAGREPEVTPA